MNIPTTRRVLVGFYTVEDFGPDSVEVACTGNGQLDYPNLNHAMHLRHPGKKIQRTGSSIEIRDGDSNVGYIDLGSGLTVRQLFDAVDTNEEPRTSRRIGSTFLGGTPCHVMLTFSRASGKIGLVLMPRITLGAGIVTFQTDISPQTPVSDLERVVRESLGSDASALSLLVRPAAPPTPLPAAPNLSQGPRRGRVQTKKS